MPAQTITSVLAQTFSLPSTTVGSVHDSFSTRTITIGGASNAYRRIYLGTSAGTGATELLAKSVCAELETALNAAPAAGYWTVAPVASGLVIIQYNGGTGTATITWDASKTIARLLGFVDSSGTPVNVSQAASTFATASYLPTHVIAIRAREGDSGYSPQAQQIAIAELPDGSTIVRQDPSRFDLRSFNCLDHPTVWADRDYPSTGTSPISPVNPDRALTSVTNTRFTQPSQTPGNASCIAPWTWRDFHSTVADHVVAMAPGNFQNIVTNSGDQTIDLGTMGAEFLRAKKLFNPFIPNFVKRTNVPGVVFRRITYVTGTL